MLVGCSGVLMGCGDDPSGPGELEVSWKTVPRSCEESGVQQVNIQLTKDEVSTDNLFPCEDGQATVSDVEAAKYSLTAYGLNEDGAQVFISETSSVTVDPESTKTVDQLELTAKPAELRVEWRFDGGAMCNSEGVEEVSVSLFDESSNPIASETFACSEGFYLFEGLTATGEYLVQAEAEGTDATMFTAEDTIELGRGEEGELIIYLAESN